MFPPKGSGLERIIKTLEAGYPESYLANLIEGPLKQFNAKIPVDVRALNISNPAQSLQKLQTNLLSAVNGLAQNITSSISKMTNKTPPEDYNEVARSFLPHGASLVTPQYPEGSGEIMQADIDEDSRNELIASYKLDDGSLRTIVLKKHKSEWIRIAEIINQEYEGIHYRNTADITGKGKQQLLLGLAAKGKLRTLYGYSFENGAAEKLFSKNYHKLEVLGIEGQKPSLPRAQIAIWSENDNETYDIDLFSWNGAELTSTSKDRYFNKKVLPYYVRQLKQKPDNMSNWYKLADALVKAGARNDAIAVINSGLKHDRNLEYTEKLLSLKDRI